MKKIALLLTFFVFLMYFWADAKNLHEDFKNYSSIRIFLKNVRNSSGENIIDIDEFRDIFNDVLKKRIEIKFAVAEKEESADVIVTADIKEFIFREKVLPRPFGRWVLIADFNRAEKFGAAFRALYGHRRKDSRNIIGL